MIQINLKKIDEWKDQGADIQLVSYHLYTSVYDFTPKLSFTYKSSYLTPDSLGLFIGSSFPITYNFLSKENGEEVKTPPKPFTGFCVESFDVHTGDVGLECTVKCIADIEFYQVSDLRRSYRNKYGNEVIEDVLNSSSYLKQKQRNIAKTNNVTTLYRTLGESDFDFISNQVLNEYSINLGQPLFYLGLDNTFNFTSINTLASSTNKSKVILKFKNRSDDVSEKFIEKKLKDLTDDNAITLNTQEAHLQIGLNESVNNIKNQVFYTNLQTGLITTTAYGLKPGSDQPLFYPIDRLFMSAIKNSQVTPLFNRPSENISYEVLNLFKGLDQLITIEAEISNVHQLQHLILAGDSITVITSYPYSVYNGNYTITDVEYGQDQTAFFMKVKLSRTAIDTTWTDELTEQKENDDFKFPFAPELRKNLLYTV